MTSGTVHCDPTMRQVAHLEFSIKVTVTFGPLFFPILNVLICDAAAASLQKKNQTIQEWLEKQEGKGRGKKYFCDYVLN